MAMRPYGRGGFGRMAMRPYGRGDEEDGVHVVGHDHEVVEFDLGAQLWRPQPFLFDDSACRR